MAAALSEDVYEDGEELIMKAHGSEVWTKMNSLQSE